MDRNQAIASPDARSAILAEATRLFESKGIDGVSMRQVADAAGYSATTIYHHFDDKNDLMYAVCVSGFAEFGAALAAAGAASNDPLESLRAAGRAYVEFALTHPLHYDVMFIRPKSWAIGQRALANSADSPGEPASFVGLVDAVEGAMRAGALRNGDPRHAATLVWAGLHGTVALAISMGDQMAVFEPDAVRRRAAELLDATLASLAD
jgi:AcrR family transcriptional regulator